MTGGREEEIRASVGAHRELGPDYDDVLAEGLVERIGAEIDKRIDERLGQHGLPSGAGGSAAGATGAGGSAADATGPAGSAAGATGPGSLAAGAADTGQSAHGPAGYQVAPVMPGYQGFSVPFGYQGPGYPWYHGYQPPVPLQAPPQAAPGGQGTAPSGKPTPAATAQRSVATTITALGSMAIGVVATAIVSSHFSSAGAQAFLVVVIWVAISVINVAYARHR